MKRIHKGIKPVLVAVAILLFGILAASTMDSLEARYALRLDYSFNSVTTQSEQTEKIVRGLKSPIHAYALSSPGMEDQALLGLLGRLSALNPLFSYSQENLVQNPLLVHTLSSDLQDELVQADSLILVNTESQRARVLNPIDYLQQDFDIDSQSYVLRGLAYEKNIAEALLYLSLDSVPSVRILTGHGEITQSDTAYLESLLASHHFEIDRVNLLRDEALAPEDLLLVLSPQTDLSEIELDRLLAFSRSGGNMLITSDYSDPDSLPRFDALYRLMGFERKPGIVIAEGADLTAYIDNPLFLTPYMDMTEPTAELIGAGMTRLRLPGARAFAITATGSDAKVDPLLYSGMAYIKPVQQANQSLAKEEGDEEGRFPLALISDYAHPDGTRSRAMVIGNSAILLDRWLHEVSFGEQFLLHMVNYLSHEQPIRLDIAPKVLVREPLQIAQPLVPALLLIGLPLLVLGLAALVLLRRTRRQ